MSGWVTRSERGWVNLAERQRLEAEGIAHSLARPHHPQTCGKIEALHSTITPELLARVRLNSFTQAAREIAAWYQRDNVERTHMGIGGVTPADRYFGRVERVVSTIQGGIPPADRPGALQRLPGERAVVLQLALVDGRMELWFAGRRSVLG